MSQQMREQLSVRASSSAALREASSLSPEQRAQEGWTNMLPRPSELFASGIFDDFGDE